MVFTYLEPKEAASFRWAGRVVAEIGLQYLTPKVHLRLKEESYDRLLAIAENPVASKYVVELEYETEGLLPIERQQFDEILTFRSLIPQRHASSERPGSVASARAWRAYERDSSRIMPLPSKRKTAQLLNRAWSIYEDRQAGHRKVEQADFFLEKMTEIFKRLPNLKMFSTAATSVYEQYVAEIRELLPFHSFSSPYGFLSNYDSATKSVLLAAESAGLQINSFCCQRFHWQALTQDKRDLPALRRSMLPVKIMNIALAGPPYMPQSGLVLSFITSAPNLEYLRLSFGEWNWDGIHPPMKDTIGNFFWSSLRAVSLQGLTTNENHLGEFCERHARTLRDLSLRDIYMEEGSWNTAFHRMRRAFRFGQQLDACKLGGSFWGEITDFHMGVKGPWTNIQLGMEISGYIQATDVGDISLDEYFQAVRRK